ncbi:MAG: aminodeoxychorismate/anthranilate synthase component II [Elusimicrobia bacterium]|nr:aminodeoxychorismate/anthranilate synthase component II [Elusimicrobiota bacterium]
MILVIDNYDSFVYNLVQYIGEITRAKAGDIGVFRNNTITVPEIKRKNPECIIISPGPCTPKEAGVSVEVVRHFAGKIPILGVCLGHQAIVYALGGRIVRAAHLMHGKTSLIYHDGRTIFRGLVNPFEATRYHSLIVEGRSFPKTLEVSARTKDGEIMGARMKKSAVPLEGVQFHPESVLTKEGKGLLKNFLRMYSGRTPKND